MTPARRHAELAHQRGSVDLDSVPSGIDLMDLDRVMSDGSSTTKVGALSIFSSEAMVGALCDVHSE